MIDVDEARRRLMDEATQLETIEVSLAEALGRVLAEEVVTDRDLPPTDRSAMDGFAVRTSDLPEPDRTLRVVGEVRAGQPADAVQVGAGEAARVFTGACIPTGADAVVMVELTVEDRSNGTVRVRERPDPGQHIRRRGEEVARGERILEIGQPVRPAEVAALATVGRTRVQVVRSPKVAVLSTGDEIVEPEAFPAPHEIRNSNAPMLLALLRELGIEGRYLGIAPDRPEALERVLAEGLEADLLLLTGGVSVGEYDLAVPALERAGMRLLFHKVAMRPGKPALAGRREKCLVVGLPGNPVSAFTGFQVLVVPALRRMMGHATFEALELRAVLGERLRRFPGRTTFHLAELQPREGRFYARPARTMGSGDVVSLSRSNAFVVTEGSSRALEAGTEVTVLPWHGFEL
jgi:molybdopterin molybdotransferase